MRRPGRDRPTKRVLHCPHCQSTHVIFEGALITGQVYHCLDCDYVGSLIFETDEPVTD